ncbi:unnamed protein product, partial [Trichogramma brassicae]
MSTDEVAKRVAETDTKKKPVAEMVMEALGNLMDKKGSSLQAIKKYMASFYAVDINRQAIFIRKFLKAAVEKGTVEQVKGSGTSGRFRIPKDVVKAKEKKAAKESKKTAKKKVSQASDDDKSSSEEQEEEPAEKPGAPAKKAEKTLKKQPATANKSEKPTKKGPDAAKTAKNSGVERHGFSLSIPQQRSNACRCVGLQGPDGKASPVLTSSYSATTTTTTTNTALNSRSQLRLDALLSACALIAHTGVERALIERAHINQWRLLAAQEEEKKKYNQSLRPGPTISAVSGVMGTADHIYSCSHRTLRSDSHRARKADFIARSGPIQNYLTLFYIEADRIDGFKLDLNYIDDLGCTHFHVACEYGLEDVVQKFLELGQDPNLLVQKTGNSPLYLALSHDQKEVSRLLLKHGADPSLANKDGRTPLHVLSENFWDSPNMEMIFELKKKLKPGQVDARDKLGNTPLHLAGPILYSNANHVIRALLEIGANPNVANDEGLTPMHIICKKFYKDSLWELFWNISNDMKQPVQLNARDKSGNTPLHYALQYTRNYNMVEFLLKNGADPNSVNEEGLTPLHIIAKTDNNYRANKFFNNNKELNQLVQVDARDKLVVSSTSIEASTHVSNRTMSGDSNKPKNLNYEDILEAQKKDEILIIDVREDDEIRETGKLPGSIHIPIQRKKKHSETELPKLKIYLKATSFSRTELLLSSQQNANCYRTASWGTTRRSTGTRAALQWKRSERVQLTLMTGSLTSPPHFTVNPRDGIKWVPRPLHQHGRRDTRLEGHVCAIGGDFAGRRGALPWTTNADAALRLRRDSRLAARSSFDCAKPDQSWLRGPRRLLGEDVYKALDAFEAWSTVVGKREDDESSDVDAQGSLRQSLRAHKFRLSVPHAPCSGPVSAEDARGEHRQVEMARQWIYQVLRELLPLMLRRPGRCASTTTGLVAGLLLRRREITRFQALKDVCIEHPAPGLAGSPTSSRGRQLCIAIL